MLIEADFDCAACGSLNETVVDPSQGERQSYVEDCQVCCRANVLTIRVSDSAASVEARTEDD